MKPFKHFYFQLQPTREFIAFSNAGGREGQYDGFDYTEPFMHGQGGGREDLEENLNPRDKPQYIKTHSQILFDPERDNTGLGEDHNSPENIGIPDSHGNGYANPNYTDEQAKHATMLSASVHEYDPHYHQFLNHYTTNSYNLNNRLIEHHRAGKNPPEHVESHLDYDVDDEHQQMPIIHVPSFDKLIHAHKMPDDVTVYSGLHFHPNQHQGKIAMVPSYMSTSLSPHVAKDFGKQWIMTNHDGGATIVKNILRLHLPKGHSGLFADNASHFPGQGEIILPRGMRYQIGQRPTHVIEGKFRDHFNDSPVTNKQYHIWTGRILPAK